MIHDMHTHTSFSDDVTIPKEEMIRAAVASGLSGIAITDHYDPGYPDPEFPFLIDFSAYDRWVREQQARHRGQLEILYGLEIGIMEGQLEMAGRQAAAYDYDFIIGSFHCYRGEDLYKLDYEQRDKASLHIDFYHSMAECLAVYEDYDVVGHFSIIDRYIGEIFDLTPVEPIIREILAEMIERGKGLEINTSHRKYRMPVDLPRREILRWYRELGGEILTIGSDAHEPHRYGDGFQDAIELAKSLGFGYYTVFRQRRPEFLPLP